MIPKLILSSSFDFDGPAVSLVPVHRRGVDWSLMTKQASMQGGLFREYLESLRPLPGKTVIHVIAVGDEESYGPNRNGDGFSRDDNITAHRSFKDNGHVFKHHCFTGDTLVTLHDGSVKPIMEVTVGELVRTAEGGTGEVVKAFEHLHDGLATTITCSGTPSPITATDEHPFLVYRREQIHCRHNYSRLTMSQGHVERCTEIREPIGQPDWVKAGDIRCGDYLVSPGVVSGQLDEPDLAECIGWVASEGHLGPDGVQFTFGAENDEDITSCSAAFERLGYSVKRYTSTHGLPYLVINSRQLSRLLAEFLVGVKDSKQFTEKVFELNEESLYRLLGAYIDGDGHVAVSGKNKGQLRIRSASPHLLRQVGDLIFSLQIPNGLIMDRAERVMTSPTPGYGDYLSRESGCVTIPQSQASKLLTYSRKGDPEYSTQRVGRSNVLGRVQLRRVTSLEHKHLSGTVYNLEVESSHTYVAGTVAVHNCNKDPFKAVGEVMQTGHHALMSRIELLMALDNEKCRSEIDGLERGEDLPVSMGCFTAGHLLTLDDGSTVRLEDAVEGQQVLTHLGRRLPITHVFDQDPYTGTLYTIVAQTIRDVEATADHPFFVVPQEQVIHTGHANRRVDPSKLEQLSVVDDAKWVPAKELRAGDYLVTPVNKACRPLETTRRGGRRLRVGNFILTPIDQIQSREVKEEPIYNIEVQGDNSYLVNGVAVHNSMQDFDECSVCNHRAATADMHCRHIKEMLGLVLSDGRRVYMKNPKPKYFDISLVFKPADRIAYTLRKVAEVGGQQVLGGHDLAEIFGLVPISPKIATLRALASIRKEVPTTLRLACRPNTVRADSIRELQKQASLCGLPHLLKFLHANGWLLGPEDFGQVIRHPNPGQLAASVDQFGSLDSLMEDHTELPSLEVPRSPSDVWLSPSTQADLEDCCSMDMDPVRQRVLKVTIIRPAKVAGVLPPEPEARALATLYGCYKLAFATHNTQRPGVLRTVAATF